MLDDYLPFFEHKYGEDVEFIVVVNGSTDGTGAVVEEYAERHKNIKIMVEPRKIGKGGAVMLGFSKAAGDFVGYVDADGATPPDAFDDLIEHIGEAGAIIASRWLPESDVNPPQPFRRRAASRVFNTLTRIMFGFRITDTQCGAKLMKKSAVEAILPDLGITRWAFDVDLLYQFKRRGWDVIEIPTTWHHVGGSQLRVGRASVNMFLALVRLRLVHSPFSGLVRLYHRYIGRHIDRHILKPPGLRNN